MNTLFDFLHRKRENKEWLNERYSIDSFVFIMYLILVIVSNSINKASLKSKNKQPFSEKIIAIGIILILQWFLAHS